MVPTIVYFLFYVDSLSNFKDKYLKFKQVGAYYLDLKNVL